MVTQVTIKLSDEEKDLIQKAADSIGLGHSSFMRAVSLERAREIVKTL